MKNTISCYLVKISLLFLMTMSGAYAQIASKEEVAFASVKEVKDNLEYVFSGFENNRVPCGILLDKSLAFEDITRFDGGLKEPYQILPFHEHGGDNYGVRLLTTDDNGVEKYVSSLVSDDVRFVVYSLNGQQVITTREKKVDLNSLNKGIYIINAFVNDGERIELKVIKN